MDEELRNPTCARTKGSGKVSTSTGKKAKRNGRKPHVCSVCKEVGHNKKCFPLHNQDNLMGATTQIGSNTSAQGVVLGRNHWDCGNVDMVRYSHYVLIVILLVFCIHNSFLILTNLCSGC